MTQNDPRILTKAQLDEIKGATTDMPIASSNDIHRLLDHIDALTEVVRYYYEEVDEYLNDESIKASHVMAQIDPPPPAQTISAARLDGKVRL